MLPREIKKRLSRIVGKFDPECIISFDEKHFIVRPNSFSKNGTLIDGRILTPISYGDIGCIAVSMTYGLSSEQIGKILDQCIFDVRRIQGLLRAQSWQVAYELGRDVVEELCLCLNSVKKPNDKTLSDVIRHLSLSNRKKYMVIAKILKEVPKLKPAQKIALCLSPLHSYKGRFGSDFLQQNQKDLIQDARKSFIPYLTNSTFEQDHFGIGKMKDDDLVSDKDTFAVKSSAIPYSSLHIGGIESLADRTGASLSGTSEDRVIDPVKKKKLFAKSLKVLDYLEKHDDEAILDKFGKMISLLGFGKDSIEYNRLMLYPPQMTTELPFVLPMIVLENNNKLVQVEYSPMEALDLMVNKMTTKDFGSPNRPFPFGGDQPLAKPRRIKSEVR